MYSFLEMIILVLFGVYIDDSSQKLIAAWKVKSSIPQKNL